MTHASPPALHVLLAVRLRAPVGADELALITGLDEPALSTALVTAREHGLVDRRDGKLPGYVLTPAGRAEVTRQVGEELDMLGARTDVTDVYAAFRPLNAGFLDLCTRWQLVGGDATRINDHADDAYDRAVIDELGSVHHDLGRLVDRLSVAVPRYDSYAPRFEHALGNVRAGRRDWFASPRVDSYHAIWFELHEDLLVTLGVERAHEAAAG